MLDEKRRTPSTQEDLDAMDESFAKMKAQFLQAIIDGKPPMVSSDFLKLIQHLSDELHLSDEQFDYNIGNEEGWGNQE